MNPDTCKVVLWGFRNEYNTFGHIHEAFYRAFKYLGREVYWVDGQSDLSQIDFSDTLFLTCNVANFDGLPVRQDGLYVVHNHDDRSKAYLKNAPVLNYGVLTSTTQLSGEDQQIEPEIWYSPQPWEAYSSVQFRWGTDLLPHEIEANKPSQVFNPASEVINYVGTVQEVVFGDFRKAAEQDHKTVNVIGGFSGTTPVSIEENVRLIRESFMAPAVNIQYQNDVGYIPCRIFKNISYGQLPPTNNPYVQDYFGGRLIYSPEPYELYWDAKSTLPKIPLKQLHDLMDEVAQKHTYLNKISGLLKAVKLSLQERNA